MKNKRAIILLGSLERDELNEFKKFVSAFSPKANLLLDLLEYLKKAYPKFEGLTPEITLKKVKSIKSPTALDNQMTNLRKVLEDFMVWKQLKSDKNKSLRENLLIDSYHDRELDDLALKNTKTIIEKLKNKPFFLWDQYLLIKLNYQLFFSDKFEKYCLNSAESLHELEFTLNNFYTILKRKIKCEYANRTLIVQKQVKKKEPQHNHPTIGKLIKIYDSLTEVMFSFDQTQYTYVSKILLNKEVRISKEEQLVLVNYLNTIINSLLKKGYLEYINDMFTVYDFAINEGLFSLEQSISSGTFNNVIHLGCKMNKFDWVNDFMTTHQIYLPKKTRNDIVLIAEAQIAFEKKNYEKVLSLINKVELNDNYCKYRKRVLLLSSYVELEKFDRSLESMCDSFKQFLNRSKFYDEYHVIGGLNLIRVIRELYIEKKLPKSIQEKSELADYINNQEIAHKSWLIDWIKRM